MANFTLKVIDDKASGYLVPDTMNVLGGTDMLQAAAFRHLFPDGECAWVFRELLYEMAELHGWRVSITVREPEFQHNVKAEPRDP